MNIVMKKILSDASRDSTRPWIDTDVRDGVLYIGEANIERRSLAIAGTSFPVVDRITAMGGTAAKSGIAIYVTMGEEIAIDYLMEVQQQNIAFIGFYNPLTDILEVLDFEDIHSGEKTYEAAMDAQKPESVQDRVNRRVDEALVQIAQTARFNTAVREETRRRLAELKAERVQAEVTLQDQIERTEPQ